MCRRDKGQNKNSSSFFCRKDKRHPTVKKKEAPIPKLGTEAFGERSIANSTLVLGQ